MSGFMAYVYVASTASARVVCMVRVSPGGGSSLDRRPNPLHKECCETVMKYCLTPAIGGAGGDRGRGGGGCGNAVTIENGDCGRRWCTPVIVIVVMTSLYWW